MAGRRVAIKFCGGCDPAYERGEYFRAIRRAAGGRIHWVRPKEADWERLLLICGCATACPVEELAQVLGASLVCRTDDAAPPDKVVAELLAPGNGESIRGG